jgi:pimeloyl-ACP methyl ester carboxylesterase
VKPLALLIPGLDGTGRLYYGQVDSLSQRHRVLAWEFKRRANFTFSDLVEELAEGTSGEEPKSIAVVGESFGGTVAMHFALAFPERIRCLVLINSFAFYTRRFRLLIGLLLAPMLQWKGIRNIKDYVTDSVLAREGVSPEDRRRYREIVQEVDLAAYRRRLALVREVDLRARLKEISVPTRVLASGRDKIVPSVSQGGFMTSCIPDARLHVFPKAGHALLLTPGFCLADYM